MDHCIYLRKSRADAEAEARGEGETLSRHQNMLLELGKKQQLNIVKIYREIVSGDSIAARPQMQALLADVAEGKYAGVLVVEIERLARGDTIDQGIVAQTFRRSSTKIITPTKTYDPDNEFDEEYFEFSLFMSRREYKTIKRRMQAGRLASVKEGNYIGSSAPYGYRKINPEPKIHTLEIVPEEAEVVRLIYKLYLDGHGSKFIANELNRIGISPQKSTCWQPPSIKKILSNPIYCGKIGWKTKSNGDALYNGLHSPIVSEELFDCVRQKKRTAPAPQLSSGRLLNYYHGIMFCQNCRRQMKRRYTAQSGQEHLLCSYGKCAGKTVGSTFDAVDEAVIAALRYRLKLFRQLKKIETESPSGEPDLKLSAKAELARAKRRLSRMYDLLEQEIYDQDTFLQRSQSVAEKITALQTVLEETAETPQRLPLSSSVQTLRQFVMSFDSSAPEEKNQLLRSAVHKILYSKTIRMYPNSQSRGLSLSVEFL